MGLSSRVLACIISDFLRYSPLGGAWGLRVQGLRFAVARKGVKQDPHVMAVEEQPGWGRRGFTVLRLMI